MANYSLLPMSYQRLPVQHSAVDQWIDYEDDSSHAEMAETSEKLQSDHVDRIFK